MADTPETVVRAITLPVAAPVDLTWVELDAALLPAFRLSTELANWCVRRLFVLDDSASAKAPPAVKQWKGYADAGANYPQRENWKGAAGSFAAVIRAAHAKYLQLRWEAVHRFDSSLLTYRFPQPFVIRAQEWEKGLTWGEGGPVLTVPLPGVGRVALRLRQGREFGRQLGLLRMLHDGTAERGTVALMRNRKGSLHAKLVGTFPVREPDLKPANACFLHTDPNALLVAEVNGRRVAITNGDHVKGAVAVHKLFLQRAGEDKKREVRMDRRRRRNFDRKIDDRCGKQRERIDTAIHQVAAQVVRFCERQRVGLVVYDDSARDFIPEGFAWHAVGERLADKLRAVGILLVSRSTVPEKEFPEWLADPKAMWAAALAGKRLAAHKGRPKRQSHPAVSPRSGTARSSTSTRSKT